MSLLIISLSLDSASPTALFDYVQSLDGSTASHHASVPLALLPQQAGQQVVLVLPAQALSWHQVQLPQGSLPRSWKTERSGRLRAILDGLLEDQLLDDPAQLHLALQPQPDTSGPVWVLACARDWLHNGLKALAQAGHEVSRIVPEFSLHSLADAIVVTGQPEAAQVAGVLQREAGPAGLLVCTLTGSVAAWLDHPAQAAPGTDAPPPVRQIVAEPAVAALAEALFKRPVQLLQRPQRLLQAAQGDWDLAQFELAQARRSGQRTQWVQALRSFMQAPSWRGGRWALATMLLVNLLGLNALAWHEKTRLQAQRAQIRAVLTDTFPNIPVVVDAPLQMAREVTRLQQTRGRPAGTDLEGMLASFSAVAPEGYAPSAIDYVANELRLSGPPIAAQQQPAIVSALQAKSLNARPQGEQWLISPVAAP